MKTKILSLLLVLVLVIGITALNVMAEETTAPAAHENHCVCGGNGNGRGDHVCADSGVITEWKPFSTELLVATSNENRFNLPAGNYYLTEKTVLTGIEINILEGTEVTFCLNGYELTSARRLFRVNGTLNITDCQPTRDGKTQNGKIIGNNTNAPVLYGYSGGHINLYRGILTGKTGVTRNYGAVLALATDAGNNETSTAGSSMTMYGGTIDASKLTLVKTSSGGQGSGGAIILMGTTGKPCTFIQYGGTVKGAKSVETNGAAIAANATDTVKILGNAVVEAGDAANYGDGIYGATGSTLVVGGKAKVEDMFILSTHRFSVENLEAGAKIGLSAGKTNFNTLAEMTEADAAYFTSNVAGRPLVWSEGKLSFANHGNHCECGGNLTDEAAVAAHGECVVEENWIALTNDNILEYLVTSDTDDGGTANYLMFAENGSYYLAETINIKKPIEIHNGDDITLCLNGYNWNYSKGYTLSAFRVWGDLNFCDCVGSGKVTSAGGNSGAVMYLHDNKATADYTVNIYGGTFTATGNDASKNGGIIQIGNAAAATTIKATLNIFGGTITGGTAAEGGNIYMTRSAKAAGAAILNIYGGEITNGTAGTDGGNICIKNSTVTIHGGKISGGTSSGNGGNILVHSGTVAINAGEIINGSANARGGNIYIAGGAVTVYGGNITGGTLTAHERGLDIGLAATDNTTLTLDGKVNIGEIGVHGNNADKFALHLTQNFSTEKVINIQSTNLDKIIVGATKATLDSFAPTNENAQLVYEGGAIYMRDAAVHYACYCGGTYEADGSTISHTCELETSWVAVNAEFLANSATTTEEVAGTDADGNPTTETVTTVTGWGSPVNYVNDSLGGTYYEIPSGYYYLTEDLVLEHGLRVVKGADVKIDLNGHTITAPTENARALFLQGSLRICDSSYDATKENKADQFKGGIIAARAANYSLAYVSADGELRIYGGNYYSTADCSKNTQGLIGATGKVYFFDGYYVASDMNGNGALVVLQLSGSKSGSLAVRKATLVGAAAKNGGIVSAEKDGTSLKIYSGDLIGSTVTTFGGAIYMTNGDLEVRGGTITGGTAVRGGNIHMGAETTTKVVKGTISNGTAIGAASGSNGGGGNIYTAGSIEISGGTITGGSATRTQSSAQAYGGNIYQNDTTASKLFKITGGTIENGSAVTGGNIFVRGNFEMTNGTITGGNAFEATGGNLRVEGKNNNTATITGGTISNGTSVQQGGNLFLRNITGDMVISNATITGGSCTSSHGGSVYVTGMTATLTMENTTISGGSACDRGGNLYIIGGAEELAVVTMTNCTITDGTAGTRGGNIYVSDVDATLNNCTVTGGQIVLTGKEEDVLSTYGYNLATNFGNYATHLTINGGTYKDAGENNVSPTSFHVLSGDKECTLTISGLLEIDDLRLGTGRMLTIGEAGLEEGSSIGISRFEVTGLIAPGAAQYQNCFRTDYANSLFTDVVGEDLYIVSDYAYWAFTATNKALGAASSIEEAYEKYADSIGFVRVVQPDAYVGGELMQLDKPVYLDINGSQYAGLIVGSPIYVIDSKTNKYEEGAAGIFAYDVIEGGSVNDGKTVINSGDCGVFNSNVNYVMVDEGGLDLGDTGKFDTAKSFHAISTQLTYISLDPAHDALGYKAEILGDSKAKTAVDQFGLALNVEGLNPVNYLKAVNAEGTVTLRLKNILKNNGGEMTIYGAPVIVIGDTTITGKTTNTTMKKTIEAVETAVAANAEAFTQAQIEAVQALLAQYEEQVAAWDIDSILAWTVPTTQPEETV